MRRGITALLPIVMGLALWPAGATAGEWLFGPFSAGVPYSYGAQHGVAMNGSGEAALIFGFNGVRVSSRASGGSFEDPEWGGLRVSAEGVEGSTPAVAINNRGDVVAIWQQYTSAHRQIYEASRPAGGDFGAPRAISPEDEEASAPAVAIDAQGEATVAWLNNDGTNEVVEAATATLGGSFSSPVGLSGDGGNASDPQVVTSSTGASIVSWERMTTAGLQLEAAVRPAAMAFPLPDAHGDGDMLGETSALGAPHVVQDEAGEALAVWKSPSEAVWASRLPAGGSLFGPAVTLASATGLPSAAMNEAGQAVAAWPSGHAVQVVSAAPGAPFGAPVELSSYFAPAAAQVAISATGNTTVEWEGISQGGLFGREGSYRPSAGAFAKPKGSYTSGIPEESSIVVASDSAGDMIGVWDSSGLHDMQAMLFDAGPQLVGVSAPAGGQVGQPLYFSTPTPSSVWRPLNSITWSFGDGTTASGQSVSHAYAAPGAYQVTVTATDTQRSWPPPVPGLPGLFPEYVGNSEGQTVTVSAAPTPATTTPPLTASVSLASTHITTTRSGNAALKLTCNGTVSCKGKLTLTAKVKGGARSRPRPRTSGRPPSPSLRARPSRSSSSSIVAGGHCSLRITAD